MWRPERRAKKYLSARLGAGRAVARAREMAQMAAAGGADAPFGVSCTPAARPRRAPQKYLGDLFVINIFAKPPSELIIPEVKQIRKVEQDSRKSLRGSDGYCTPLPCLPYISWTLPYLRSTLPGDGLRERRGRRH